MLLNRARFTALAAVCAVAAGSWMCVSPMAHADDGDTKTTIKVEKISTVHFKVPKGRGKRQKSVEYISGTASCKSSDVDDFRVFVGIRQGDTYGLGGGAFLKCDGTEQPWKYQISRNNRQGDDANFGDGKATLTAAVWVGETSYAKQSFEVTLVEDKN